MTVYYHYHSTNDYEWSLQSKSTNPTHFWPFSGVFWPFFCYFWPFSAVCDPCWVCLMTYFLHYYTSDYFWPIQSISSHFLLHPAISGHFSAIFLAIFGHFWPPVTPSGDHDHFIHFWWPFLSTTDYFWPLQSISSHFQPHPAISVHFWPFSAIFGHFQPPVVPSDHYQPIDAFLMTISCHYWLFLTISKHFEPPPTTFSHFWPFSAIFGHFRQPVTHSDLYQALLTTSDDHFWPLMTISDRLKVPNHGGRNLAGDYYIQLT